MMKIQLRAALVFVFAFGSLMVSVSQNTGTPQWQTITRGTFIHREQHYVLSWEEIEGVVVVLKNVQTQRRDFTLRLTSKYYKSQYDNGTVTKLMDIEEINSAIYAITHMIKTNNETTGNMPYTEYWYETAEKCRIGFYIGESKRGGFLELSDKKFITFDMKKMESLKSFFEAAKALIIELEG